MNDKIVPGDVVTLKSGSIKMTVAAIKDEVDAVLVFAPEGGQPAVAVIAVAALKKVE